MGRIKTMLVKKIGKKLIKMYPDKFTTDFETNKNIIKELNIIDSKKIRNKVAGYIVRVKKREIL